MGISKTEVNLRRLLAAAPQQQNQAKLMHYVATLREQLEQLAEERTSDGLPMSVENFSNSMPPLFLMLPLAAPSMWMIVSKAMVNDYSEKIEAIASKLSDSLSDLQQVTEEPFSRISVKVTPSNTDGEGHIPPSPGLRRRLVPASNMEDRSHDQFEADASAPIKLDAAAQAHIQKHRKLQEDLTDEMVTLAQRLKETSLMMSQSVQNTEKLLDSTEKAVEQSLANTGRANVRAMEIYSKSSKTTCFTWLLVFLMTCIFVMVVLLIRVT